MGFIIGSLVENLKLKDVQLKVGNLIIEELKGASDIHEDFLSAGIYDKIYANLNAKDRLIVGLNIMDKHGVIVYSDEKTLVGKTFSDKRRISKTIEGPIHYIIDRNLISQETALKEKYTHLMLLFHPYSINNELFTIQVIYNILGIEKDINKINVLMWFTILLSIGVVFVSLITITTSASKTLEKLKTSLEVKVRQRTRELEKSRLYLDKQVKERTKLLEDSNKKSIERYYELQKLTKDTQKQNRDIIRKTLDLTELKGQLEDKNIELQDANRQISNALQVKTQFINQAAHDLGTPLTPILTLLPLIKRRIKDKKAIYDNKKDIYDLTIVENNAKNLSEIVKELIALIKTEAKGVEYKFQKLSFTRLIGESIKNYKVIFENNKIKVLNKSPDNLPMIEGDKHKLTELLENLISNAVKFMPKGGALEIAAKKIDNFINVRISDSGIGMTKNTLSSLFEEFFKADKSRHYKGSGLGLSICKRIVEGHNGKIWAESAGLGKGSTIAFSIPIRQTNKAEVR